MRFFFLIQSEFAVRHRLTIIFLMASAWTINAQTFTAANTKYSNTFREWEFYTLDENTTGQMWMRWPFQNDWTSWDLSVGDLPASIQQENAGDPNFWVIRCNGVIVNARTAWKGEFYRWKLSDGQHQINWEARYANQRDQWATDRLKEFPFQMKMDWKGDPRQWTIEDQLPDEISLAMKLAMIFLAIHFSAPQL